MDNNYWGPPQVGEPAMDGGGAGDWRSQLQPDSRQRIVSKIMDALKRHFPFSAQVGLQERKEIIVRFEEKSYSAAISQSDYLRRIAMRIPTMVTLSQNAGNSNRPPDPAMARLTDGWVLRVLMDNNNSRHPQVEEAAMDGGAGDWRSQLQLDSRQRIVNKIMDTLKRHLLFSGQEGLQELKKIAVRFEEKIYSAATSRSDYLRIISLKMLMIERKSQNTMANVVQVNSGVHSNAPPTQG